MPELTAMPRALSATLKAVPAMPNGNAKGAEESVIAALAGAGELGLSPAELQVRTGLAERTQRWAVNRLMEAGLVGRQGERGRLFLTQAGMAQTGSATPEAPVGSPAAALDAALGLLPAETLRAFVRLLVSVVVARHHLHEARPSGWLSAIACGPTGTGKTLAGAIVCRVLGLNPALHIRLVGSETERSLWGRREQVPGGGWAFRPSPALGLPFLGLDELDKAPAELRVATLKLLQGEARVPAEDGVVEVLPAVLATTNASPASIRSEYQRRAVVLGTSALQPLLADMDVAAGRILAPGRLPALDLGRLRPPSSELPEADLRAMRELLKTALTEDGWVLCGLRGLELAALGRAAVWGLGTSDAAVGTATDYLACAWTVGEVLPERLADLRLALSSGAPPALALEAGEAERKALVAARQAAKTAREAEVLKLIGARAAVAARIEEVERLVARRCRFGQPGHARAVGYCRQLSALRRQVLQAKSAERLEELRELGDRLLAALGQDPEVRAALSQEARSLPATSQAGLPKAPGPVAALPMPTGPLAQLNEPAGPAALLPVPVTIGALAAWRCGHIAEISTRMVWTGTSPDAVRCPICQRAGLELQVHAGQWHPVQGSFGLAIAPPPPTPSPAPH
jgi:hypothetical protein